MTTAVPELPVRTADGSVRQYLALDGCRGVAACLVALFHFRSVLHVHVNSHVAALPLIANAWLAVDFFFVLSGFVIAANYQDRLAGGAVRLRDFVALRLGRLYPLHLFTLLAMLLVVAFFRYGATGAARPDMPAAQWSMLAFIANLLLVHGLHVGPSMMWNQWNHPSWSISAEFATYLVFAMSWRFLRRYAWVVIGLTIVIAPTLILMLHGNLDVTYDWGLLRAMLGFALGVVAFNAMRQPAIAAVFAQLTGIEATIAELVLALTACLFISFAGETPVSIAAPFVFAGIVLLYSREKGAVTRALATAPARALGRWSYSIYMVHYPMQLTLIYAAVALGAHGALWLFGIADGAAGAEVVLGRSPWVGDAATALMMVVLLSASAWTYRAVEDPWRKRARARVYAGARLPDSTT